MKFVGGGGGTFAKFEKVGDKFAGVVTGTRELPNKFQAGALQTVVDIVSSDGLAKTTVRLDKKALIDAWAVATAKCGNLVGRYVTFEFEKTYKSKNGGQPGKDITVDVADAPAGSLIITPAPVTGALGTGLEDAYAKVVELRGAESAAQIRKAVESVEKDAAKQAVMLLKAVGA